MRAYLQVKLGENETMIDFKPEMEEGEAIIDVDFPTVVVGIRKEEGKWKVVGCFGLSQYAPNLKQLKEKELVVKKVMS